MSGLCEECAQPIQYFSSAKVAKMLDVSPKTVREMARDGLITGVKMGTGDRDWKFRLDWIQEYTEARYAEMHNG